MLPVQLPGGSDPLLPVCVSRGAGSSRAQTADGPCSLPVSGPGHCLNGQQLVGQQLPKHATGRTPQPIRVPRRLFHCPFRNVQRHPTAAACKLQLRRALTHAVDNHGASIWLFPHTSPARPQAIGCQSSRPQRPQCPRHLACARSTPCHRRPVALPSRDAAGRSSCRSASGRRRAYRLLGDRLGADQGTRWSHRLARPLLALRFPFSAVLPFLFIQLPLSLPPLSHSPFPSFHLRVVCRCGHPFSTHCSL